MKFVSKQQGAAAIWFIFLIGAIMSLGALAIEGSRYIGKKARLGDALEAAAIAVGSNDRVMQDFKANVAPSGVKYSANQVAKTWIHHYINDEVDIDLRSIKRKDVSKLIGKNYLVTPYKLEYFRYDIDAVTKHNSWFNFSSWASFDSQVKVANKGVSGRIKGGHEPADVVFVADFSGSMNGRSKGKVKIKALQEAIRYVSETLYGVNDNSTFGFIPFSKRIVIKRDDSYYCASPLLAKKGSDAETIRNLPRFSELMRGKKNSDTWSNTSRKEIYKSYKFNHRQEGMAEYYVNWLKGRSGHYANSEWSEEWWKYMNVLRADYPVSYMSYDYIYGKDDWGWDKSVRVDFDDHVDIKRSAREITIKDKPMFGLPMPYGGKFSDGKPKFGTYCTGWSSKNKAPKFYNIERKTYSDKNDLENSLLKPVDKMSAGGGTDMYQGLLAAPHQFYGAKQKNRYIIVLSDGAENVDTFQRLVNAGMCDEIRHKLTHPAYGADYNFKMFVVGIGFNPSNKAYNKCFGRENIHPVYDMDKLKDRILSLITDDIGHNFNR
ncbi:pilus assembly protein TadG-related protein [Vibrio sp. SCSIO 43136]|uniref:pilus assembly protein TadG-related protein n=1 Tax=Vibrio sp. SCSIO 43136 TaxID=2819101 RepID=UPI0020757C98|nr:pilus assembly protein TadG-related protein [Vibrio sp. SCSIO 43136]USD67752.1 hypothetical protein J4N39_16320 [Vibrio sp. SCSIO 43136]